MVYLIANNYRLLCMEKENPDFKSLETLADWMDSRFVVPGTSIRFGLDSLIGLVPGVGDTLTLASSAYLIGKARSYDVPAHVIGRMIFNAFLDWFIGLIPFFGDIFDIGWKANRKNLKLLKAHARRAPAQKPHKGRPYASPYDQIS